MGEYEVGEQVVDLEVEVVEALEVEQAVDLWVEEMEVDWEVVLVVD